MRLELGKTQKITTVTKNLWQLGVLPILALGSLAGLLGVYWDIAWHIDKGRDTFFSLPHNFIYAFMLIVLVMSLYGLLQDRRMTPFHISLGKTRLNPGILIVAVGAGLVLFFAPADDLWHRLYGADITLWGPMHLVGLLGFTTATFGGLLSSWLESSLSASRKFKLTTLVFATILLGWTMLYLAEYEYNIPPFPIFWHSLLLIGLPTFTLVLIAKLNPVSWSATITGLLFTLFRLLLSAWLTMTSSLDLAGESRPLIPILIFSGLVADVLIRRKAPLWLTGLLVGLTSFLVNYPVILLQEQYNWYHTALFIGVPLGLGLSITLAYLGNATASALPSKKI